MNDEQTLICAALCALAAYLGYRYGQGVKPAAGAAQAQAAPPMDNTAWLLGGGWQA